MAFLDNVIGWISQNKATTVLSVLLFAFFISTIALAVQKNNLSSDLATCQANTPPPPDSSGLQYRLPKNVIPSHYDLLLHPNLDQHTFKGSVAITIGVTENTNRVILNSFLLNITTVTLKSSSQSLPTSHELSVEYQSLVVHLTSGHLETNTNYTLEVEFSGSLADKNIGFYTSKYRRPSDGNEVTISSSKFQPTYARQAFPCFDEPEFKAVYTIRLVQPTTNGYVALSNMPAEQEITPGPGANEVTVKFQDSPQMSTYLAVFLVADFKTERIEIDNPLGENFDVVIHLPDGLQAKGKHALDVSKAVMEHHITYFNIPYPLPKLDMAAIPDYVSGATEHWGLVTYRETSLMFDENEGSTRNKQRVASTISHELTHMWFGNLVTCKWWNDVWLNEGFASYITYKGLTAFAQSIGDDWKMEDQFLIDTLYGVMELDAKVASHPINQEASTPDEITALFDSIAYSKGASLIRMLEGFVTNQAFKTRIHNFLNEHKYKAVVTEDFLKAMTNENEDHFNVADIMKTWLEQKGYPVITVKKISETTYELTQERFLLNPDSKDKETENSPFKWHVPITYQSDIKNSTGLLWLKPSDTNVHINLEASSRWIKINNDHVGYYIVNYGNEWNQIISEINSTGNTFTNMDKAQLLHDAFKLGDSMTISYDIPMDLTTYLLHTKETEYVPWSVATSKFISLYGLYEMFGDVWDIQAYIQQQLTDIYAHVDPDQAADTDAHLKKLLREKILNVACTVKMGKCIRYVNDQFNNYLADINQKPDVDIRSVVYYHGMRSVVIREDWETIFDRFTKETDPQERAKLMEALAAPMEKSLLQRYLQIAQQKDGPIKKQDYVSVMQYIANNPHGADLVWDYVRNNWNSITDYIGLNDRTLGRMIPYITRLFSTEEKLKELEDFFTKYPNAGAGAAAREEAKETIEYNIKWAEHNKLAIDTWLKAHVTSV